MELIVSLLGCGVVVRVLDRSCSRLIIDGRAWTLNLIAHIKHQVSAGIRQTQTKKPPITMSAGYSTVSQALRVASRAAWRGPQRSLFQRCPECRHISRTAIRRRQPAEDPNFLSILDNPPNIVRSGGKKHGPGLIVLGRSNNFQGVDRRTNEML